VNIEEKIKTHKQEYERLSKPFEDLRNVTRLQKLQSGDLQEKVKDKNKTTKKPEKKTSGRKFIFISK